MMGEWIYLTQNRITYRIHGTEGAIYSALSSGVNVLEIINNESSPSTVILNGTSANVAWTNDNVINMFLTYFSNFTLTDSDFYINAYVRVGTVEITDLNGEMVSKLIPVLRKADNVIGIYDSIKREFYTTGMPRYSTIGDPYCIYEVGNWE